MSQIKVQVILFEIDCAIFYTNLHELLGQFISWANWVNLWTIAEYHVKLWLIWNFFYDDLIIINLYMNFSYDLKYVV